MRTLEELDRHLRLVNMARFFTVLIDDGSKDGTAGWVRQNYPDVIILTGDGNLWWSGAINLGASYAIETLKADYLVLWNNDIEIDDDYFQELIRILSGSERPAIIGSKIYVAGSQDIVWSAGGYFNTKTGKGYMYGYFEPDSEELKMERSVDWLTGMGTVIPRKVVEQIGYWDNENFPQYHGDSDFTFRAKLEGIEVKIYPSLKLYNHVDNSGIEHQGSLKSLYRLLTDIRSKSNLSKNLLFYRKYVKSPFAYLPLIWLYLKIIGGFIKWNILGLLGLRK